MKSKPLGFGFGFGLFFVGLFTHALFVFVFRLRVNNLSLEGKIAGNKTDLEKVSSELSRATTSLFSAENAKLHAEEKFTTTNAKLSRLEKDSEEKDRNISMVSFLLLCIPSVNYNSTFFSSGR